MTSAVAKYEIMACTEQGEFTRSSDLEIDLREFTAAGQPIRRLIFFSNDLHLPRISLTVVPGMRLIFCRWLEPDTNYYDYDRSHLALDHPLRGRKRLPLRSYQLIGVIIHGRSVINRIDLETAEVHLDVFP